jgi:cytochrome c
MAAQRAYPIVFVGWLLGLGAGCDPAMTGADPELVAEGQRVFETQRDPGNTFTCATCHAYTEPDDVRRPGHPLAGAARRAAWKNGQVDLLIDAVNSCLVEWMHADELDEADADWQALYAYLDDGRGHADELAFEIVSPPADLTGGDAAAGRALFNASCVVCHGEDGVGTERAIAVGHGQLEPQYAARRIRTSGDLESSVYTGLTGGVMPFWAADRLSDDELRDVIAWLSRDYGGDPGPEPEPDPDPDPEPDPPPPSGCGDNHPKVGQRAFLDTYFHGVAGTAEIVDDCTIEITEFTYDGMGIDVRLYGALGGDWAAGFAIGDDLVRAGGYDGDTVRFEIPAGKTLDDLDGVSVWCVDVGVDFGSGFFYEQ